MITPADRDRDAAILAGLRADSAAEIDPYSTLEAVPTAADLAGALGSGHPALIARGQDDRIHGYGLVRGWVEADGTEVRLLDVWAVPDGRRTETESALFEAVASAIEQLSPAGHRIVLGANSRDDEQDRSDLLRRLGFAPTFDMVELELTERPLRSPLPNGIRLRTARPDDAEAVSRLLARVWAGRPYFTPPGPDQVEDWLAEADLELYLLAENEAGLVGLASAEFGGDRAEVDDLGVDPAVRGRGLGSALVTDLLDRLAERGATRVRLHTEGHDPAGALRLYLRLGFTIVGRSHRFRRALWPGAGPG
ncbi:GNAT family N-acetyltransferase [Microlunatus speluncae]|uniref:GNAT family N-acetyltransferase n=1 Tax=Microlunatus speluncae TaxID=2594267 RepID=UPI0013754828|nr:GNAT family N-acetyltransferase [Microlunatus speluncae]